MTHATISYYDAKLCVVEFGYNDVIKEQIKALAGTEFIRNRWLVPIMHLPTLKNIFDRLTVVPDVVAAYHALLKRMLMDSEGCKRQKDVKALLTKHAAGIAHIEATNWRPTAPKRPRYAQTTMVQPALTVDAPDLELWLKGVKNAVKAEDRKPYKRRNAAVARKSADICLDSAEQLPDFTQ